MSIFNELADCEFFKKLLLQVFHSFLKFITLFYSIHDLYIGIDILPKIMFKYTKI